MVESQPPNVSGDDFGNVSLHHIPNARAPSAVAAINVYAFCLGAVVLELIGNIPYDCFLIRRSGWLTPLEAVNRTSYFLARYTSFVFLLCAILFSKRS